MALDLPKVEATAGEGSSNGFGGTGVNVWSKMWSLKVANKVKIFIGRACNNFLPCAANLLRRRIGTEAILFKVWVY